MCFIFREHLNKFYEFTKPKNGDNLKTYINYSYICDRLEITIKLIYIMLLKNILSYKASIVLIIAVAITACQSANTPSGEPSTNTDTLNKNELTQEVQSVVYPLPTPFEMTKMLNDIGASYVVSALNPVDRAEKYFTEKSKALNLGIYGADLAYATTYNKEQDIKLYLKAVKTLIDQLGINVDYDKLLSDDFKQKVNNKDTLVKVITNTIFETYDFLSKKSNPELSVMMVAGMWTELMYIGTHISKDTYNNTQMVNIIAKQKESYNKLVELLAKYNTNKDIKSIEEKLMILKPVFDKVDKGLHENDYNLILNTIENVRKSFVS